MGNWALILGFICFQLVFYPLSAEENISQSLELVTKQSAFQNPVEIARAGMQYLLSYIVVAKRLSPVIFIFRKEVSIAS